jgi:hypothetical protein
MPITRRFFLYGGAGALTTISFAKRAAAYAERRSTPLLIQPDHATESLYVTEDGYFYFGRPDFPETPTWRGYFEDYTRQFIDDHLMECFNLKNDNALDNAMNPGIWEDYCSNKLAPNALAYHKLLAFKLGDSARPHNKSGWSEGINFIDGFNPGNNSLFARARDAVAISLLQARLIELGTGLEIVPIEEYVW